LGELREDCGPERAHPNPYQNTYADPAYARLAKIQPADLAVA